MVECDLAKVEVAGSNPVSRSREFQALASVRGFAMKGNYSPRRFRLFGNRGAVAKW